MSTIMPASIQIYSCLMQIGEDFPKFCFKYTPQCYVSVLRIRCGFPSTRALSTPPPKVPTYNAIGKEFA